MSFDFNKDYGEQLKEAFDNHEELPEDIVKELVWCSDEDMSRGSGRWMEHKTALYECQEFYYGIDWDKGLTECQENEYWSQVPKKYKKVEIKTYTFEEVKEDK